MSNEITDIEKENIYKSLLKEHELSDIEDIVVVSDDSTKLEERLIYIIENCIL